MSKFARGVQRREARKAAVRDDMVAQGTAELGLSADESRECLEILEAAGLVAVREDGYELTDPKRRPA